MIGKRQTTSSYGGETAMFGLRDSVRAFSKSPELEPDFQHLSRRGADSGRGP